jgi:hypothetical protein
MNELEAYSDDQRRSSQPFARSGGVFPTPDFVLAKIDSEVGGGVYKWKRRDQDGGFPTFPGSLGGNATALNGTTGITAGTKIIVFASAKRWWFDDGGLSTTATGTSFSFVDVDHVITGGETVSPAGVPPSGFAIDLGAPITGEFLFYACQTEVVTDLGMVPDSGAPTAKPDYYRLFLDVDGFAGGGTNEIANSSGLGTFPPLGTGVLCKAGVTTRFTSVGSPNQLYLANTYQNGVPGGTTPHARLWLVILDTAGNYAQPNSGEIKIRIFFFQAPLSSPFTSTPGVLP